MTYKHAVILLHVSAFFGYLHGGIEQRKCKWLVIAQTCNKTVIVLMLKCFKQT